MPRKRKPSEPTPDAVDAEDVGEDGHGPGPLLRIAEDAGSADEAEGPAETLQPEPPPSKPGDGELSERAAIALKMLLDGQSERTVRKAIAAQWADADAEQIMGEVFDHLVQSARIDRDALLGWTMQAARELYRKAVEAKDIEAALKVLKEIRQLASD